MPDAGCAAVVLAAGGSMRLGQPKQLLRLNGETLVRRAARLALDAGCQPVAVVLGHEAQAVARELAGLNVRTVINQQWRQGMGASLACGSVQLGDAEAALVMVCDQVKLAAPVLTELLFRHRASGAPLTVSSYAGRLGVPAIFSHALFPELLALSGDQGARGIIERHRDQAVVVAFPEGVEDVDEAADWERLSH